LLFTGRNRTAAQAGCGQADTAGVEKQPGWDSQRDRRSAQAYAVPSEQADPWVGFGCGETLQAVHVLGTNRL